MPESDVHEVPRPERFTIPERRALAIYGLRYRFETELAILRELEASRLRYRGREEDPETTALKRRLTSTQRKKAQQEAERLVTTAEGTIDAVMTAMETSEEAPAMPAESAETESDWYWKPEEIAIVVAQQAGRQRIEAPVKDAFQALDRNWDAFQYTLRIVERRYATDPSEALATALLVRLVALFESMLAGFIRTWLLPREPTGLGEEAAAASLANAARTATKVVNGRWDHNRPWCDWFHEIAGIDVTRIAPEEWETAYEVFARRNAFVHADGVADANYRRRLKDRGSVEALGRRLTCTEPYLTKARYACEVLADVVALGLIAQFLGRSEQKAALALEPVYRAVQRKQWSAVEWMVTTALEGLPMDHQFPELLVNRWLARREQRGLPVVQVEVEAWQPEEARYRLAKAALLLDENVAIEVLKAWNPDPGELSRVRDWPLVGILSERSEAFRACFETRQRTVSGRRQREKPTCRRPMVSDGRGKSSRGKRTSHRRRHS